MLRLLALTVLLSLAAAFRPFQQTSSYIEAAFNAGQESASVLADSRWRMIGPDRTSEAWAKTYPYTRWGWVVDSGRVRGILQDPEDLNKVFVVFGGGGVWRTDNFYATVAAQPGDTRWRPLTDKLPANGGAIDFGLSSDILYYGIGDPWMSLIPSTNGINSVSGVLVKSRDGGDSWGTPTIIDPAVSVIWDLDVIPCNADGDRDTVIVATDVGLFTSTNGGRTFTQVLPSPTPNPLPNPINNTVNFWSVIRTSAGWMATGQASRGGAASVFQSADGLTWNPTPVAQFGTTSRVTLYQAMRNSPTEDVVYAVAAASDPAEWLDIFRSADGGKTFTALNVLVPGKKFAAPASATSNDVLGCVGDPDNYQADYNQALVVDPSDSTRNTFVWAGSFGAFRTANAGAAVTFVSYWAPGWDQPTCSKTQQVSYMHADAHAGIALERPAGVVPVPRAFAEESTPESIQYTGPKPHDLASMLDEATMAELTKHKKHRHHKHSHKHHDKHYGEHDNTHYKHDDTHYQPDDMPYKDDDKPYNHDDKPYPPEPGHSPEPSPSPEPGRCVDPRPPRPGNKTWDIMFGTDGGLFLSTGNAATPAGIVWDRGLQNIGISTMLITHIKGTPLSRNLMLAGLQDNGIRLRINGSTAWELLQTGDGQGQALSQGGAISALTGWVGIGNWYGNRQGFPLDKLNTAHQTNDGTGLMAGGVNDQPGWFFPNGLTGTQGMYASFGLPSAAVDPSGLVFFTRMRNGLYRSGDAGRNWNFVRTFPRAADSAEEEEENVREPLFVSSNLHNIGVAAGAAAGTLSVAVMRARNDGSNANTNIVDVTRNQGVGADATWTSSSPVTAIPGWIDDRLFDSATTTSPEWQDNTRVFVSSVALPSPELPAKRPRIAYADVTDAGIGAFTACSATGLPDTPVQRILVVGTTIYAATWFGVYRSTDNCQTFSRLGTGLPSVQVSDLYLLPGNPVLLRAATYGRSAWELQL